MRIASFLQDGKENYGTVLGTGVVDFGRRFGGRFPRLRDALDADALGDLAQESTSADLALDGLSFLPVIPEPRRIIGIGVNYSDDLRKARSENAYPSIFLRLPSSVVRHKEPVLRPLVSEMLDYEGELAVVIGKHGSRISKASALAHVAGHTCFNDTTIGDWQKTRHDSSSREELLPLRRLRPLVGDSRRDR